MRICKITIIFVLLLFLTSCLSLLDRISGVTVESIQERGKLIAVTSYGVNSYFIYRGEPFGFEYEMLKLLADKLDVELEIKLADGRAPLIDILNSDYGDIIASNIAVTRQRMREYDFTEHFLSSRQVLIQKESDSPVHNLIDLIGKEVTVIRGSHYEERLKNLSEEIGGEINIVTVSPEFSEEELIQKVANGEIDFTIADETVAMINQFYYPGIDIDTEVSFPQRVAWVVRRKSPEFKEYLDEWIEELRADGTLNTLYDKYYKINRVLEEHLIYSQDLEVVSSISEYDDLIRKYAFIVSWDWRLIASLIYQESRFKPRARSWAGAQGLMQLMPATARALGVRNSYSPEENIFAGVRHLKGLKDIWSERVQGDENQTMFILASYNAGSGHVEDAQRLARKYGKNPLIWRDNVEIYMQKLASPEYYNDPVVANGYCRGSEPYNYVRDILERFETYKKHVPLFPEEKESEEGMVPL